MTALTKKQRKEQKKMDRRHKANQLRQNKKDMVCFFNELSSLNPLLVLQKFHVSCLLRSSQKSDGSAAGMVPLIWSLWCPSMLRSTPALSPNCYAGRMLEASCIRSDVSVESVTVLG